MLGVVIGVGFGCRCFWVLMFVGFGLLWCLLDGFVLSS